MGAPLLIHPTWTTYTGYRSVSSRNFGIDLMIISKRLEYYGKLMRLDKPIGILLLLWPTLWGLWLAAEGVPDWVILWIFILGTVLMRSAGCVINDYADRNFDLYVNVLKTVRLQQG